jgi:DNA-binding response OmpR family regulator
MKPDHLKGARILVLEDEPLLSALVESAASTAGCEIVGPASDVHSALRLIETGKIDAAVLDLIVDGIHCDAVAAELAARGIPFVIMTGLGVIKGHPTLFAAPRMTKPFHTAHLLDVLAGLLADKGGRRLITPVGDRPRSRRTRSG